MADSQVKRRQFVEQKIDIPLMFQLVILLRNRKEVMYLCTKSSLALRVIGLCELVLNKQIENINAVITVSKSSDVGILKEFCYCIAQVKLDYKHLVKYLNGEKGHFGGNHSSGIKDLRNKIYKEMEGRGLIKIKKGSLFNRILLSNVDIWQRIFNKIVCEVQNKSLSSETTALLVSLNYINGLESLLLQCNETTACMIVESLNGISLNITTNTNEENRLFNEILNVLKK